MLPRAERARALILRTVAYGESDLVVHLLVEGQGRLAAFARSARKSNKRFGGALEPFSLVEVMLAERPSGDLVSLHESSLLEGYPALREDLGRLAHAGYGAELVHELTRAGEAADALFALLAQFLSRLSAASATSARLRAFELAALAAAGLSPELLRCARCGEEVPRGRARFDPAAGGLCCQRCAAPGALWLSFGARLMLEQLQQGGLAAADAPVSADGTGRPADPRAFELAAAEAAPALAAAIAHHLGRGLKSARFAIEVGAPR